MNLASKVSMTLILSLVVGCLSGCTFTTKNKGEWEFFFGTSVGVRSTASKTCEEAATVNTDFPSLEEWIKRAPDGPAPEPSPTTP